MRDNHDGMPELLEAYERDGEHFGTIELTLGLESRQFEFWLSDNDFKAVRRILQSRPFDHLSKSPYHYFIADSVVRTPGSNTVTLSIRIEQGQTGRQVPFQIPLSLAQSLLFFARLKKFSDASHLHAPGAQLETPNPPFNPDAASTS